MKIFHIFFGIFLFVSSSNALAMERMPNELLRMILTPLGPKGRRSVERVSKLWCFLSHSFVSTQQVSPPFEEEVLYDMVTVAKVFGRRTQENTNKELKNELAVMINDSSLPKEDISLFIDEKEENVSRIQLRYERFRSVSEIYSCLEKRMKENTKERIVSISLPLLSGIGSVIEKIYDYSQITHLHLIQKDFVLSALAPLDDIVATLNKNKTIDSLKIILARQYENNPALYTKSFEMIKKNLKLVADGLLATDEVIKRLSFGDSLQDEDVAILTPALARNRTLTSVDFRCNHITNMGAKQLIEAFITNKDSNRTLDFRQNPFINSEIANNYPKNVLVNHPRRRPKVSPVVITGEDWLSVN